MLQSDSHLSKENVSFASVKDIINPYNCLLKNANFPIKTSNE